MTHENTPLVTKHINYDDDLVEDAVGTCGRCRTTHALVQSEDGEDIYIHHGENGRIYGIFTCETCKTNAVGLLQVR